MGPLNQEDPNSPRLELVLEKGKLIMGKPHVPGGMDPEHGAYFLEAVK